MKRGVEWVSVLRLRRWKKLRFSVGILLLFLFVTAIMIYDTTEHLDAVTASKMDEQPGPILVIDPGHGGLDGGASAADGTTESVLNLQIAQRMEALSKLLGIRTLLTRESEELDYPEELGTVHEKKVWDQKTRLAMINSTPDAVLISVHQNRYPDPRPSGSQVFYAKTSGSAELGQLTHANLISCLCPENRRVAAPVQDSVYLMKNVTCPAILVECGFLSNYEEAKKLENCGYQTTVATILIASYLQSI